MRNFTVQDVKYKYSSTVGINSNSKTHESVEDVQNINVSCNNGGNTTVSQYRKYPP
jgi:hypothetical protein